jgi:hypothetical protein
MSQYILDLPLSIRKEIANKCYGGYMLCNTKYEPSMYNTLMGEDANTCNANKNRLARLAKIATKGSLAIAGVGILANKELSKNEGYVVSGFTIGATASMASTALNAFFLKPNQTPVADEMITGRGVACTVVIGIPTTMIIDLKRGIDIKEGLKGTSRIIGVYALGAFVTEAVGLYVADKVERLLEESNEERDLRLGFEKIPLLKDNEK